jgi:oxazoline/thiazoline dehydrogenase
MSDTAGHVMLSLRRGIIISRDEASDVNHLAELEGAHRVLQLTGIAPFLTRVVEQLVPGVPVTELEDAVIDHEGVAGLAEWFALLSRLESSALVQYDAMHVGAGLLTFTPAAAGRVTLAGAHDGMLRLSRFAHLRRVGDTLCIDSPLARGRLNVLDARVPALLAAMSVARTVPEILDCAKLTDDGWVDAALSLLVAAGVVLRAERDGLTDEDRSCDAQAWEFADLLMHARSRTSRVDLPVGGTYRFPELAPPRSTKAPMSEHRIALPVPDLAALAESDEPLSRVMERRRSVRMQGNTPLDVRQLAEFLFRTVRAMPETPGEIADGATGRIRRRVYPGGGACHPLEIYPVVSRCTGLDPGIYRYDPEAHCLDVLPDRVDDARALLQQSSVPMENSEPTQVLLVFTARFRRMSWKYEGNAYALILQEVGVLYEAMYLVATAMGLAPCAVGGGDAARFAGIIGTDPLHEASVGAFTLGSQR